MGYESNMVYLDNLILDNRILRNNVIEELKNQGVEFDENLKANPTPIKDFQKFLEEIEKAVIDIVKDNQSCLEGKDECSSKKTIDLLSLKESFYFVEKDKRYRCLTDELNSQFFNNILFTTSRIIILLNDKLEVKKGTSLDGVCYNRLLYKIKEGEDIIFKCD